MEFGELAEFFLRLLLDLGSLGAQLLGPLIMLFPHSGSLHMFEQPRPPIFIAKR